MKLKVAEEISDLFVHIEEDSPLERHVASVVINNYVARPREQHVAEAIKTAKILAVAPELLEACKWLKSEMDKHSNIWCAIREFDGCSEWIKSMREAIAKAETL